MLLELRMNPDRFVPPEEHTPSVRKRFVAAALGAIAGTLLAAVAWYFSADARWFYLAPVAALLGAWGVDYRPHVLWWHRGT